MMKKKLKEILEENYAMKVPILKQHHRYIIGKAGINIRKLVFQHLGFGNYTLLGHFQNFWKAESYMDL